MIGLVLGVGLVAGTAWMARRESNADTALWAMAAAALLALSLIGMEWPPYWFGPDGASAIPLSLYCAILLAFWAALVPWRAQPGAVEERRVPLLT